MGFPCAFQLFVEKDGTSGNVLTARLTDLCGAPPEGHSGCRGGCLGWTWWRHLGLTRQMVLQAQWFPLPELPRPCLPVGGCPDRGQAKGGATGTDSCASDWLCPWNMGPKASTSLGADARWSHVQSNQHASLEGGTAFLSLPSCAIQARRIISVCL